ncbi:MAG: hypothetical protein RO469_12040 [Thermincola sp.]|nr:hypothetical protein [Thermincola sp.]MDT3703323.1 hypothetical protein [Thermincola sp.]
MLTSNSEAGMAVFGGFFGRHRQESGCKTESSKTGSPRMSEDGEGRREVSLAVIAKREAAIYRGMPTEPSSSGTPSCCRSLTA